MKGATNSDSTTEERFKLSQELWSFFQTREVAPAVAIAVCIRFISGVLAGMAAGDEHFAQGVAATMRFVRNSMIEAYEMRLNLKKDPQFRQKVGKLIKSYRNRINQ